MKHQNFFSFSGVIFALLNSDSFDPDSVVTGMDPSIRIRIRTKMSQTCNTD
jgi:hypothetical protein